MDPEIDTSGPRERTSRPRRIIGVAVLAVLAGFLVSMILGYAWLFYPRIHEVDGSGVVRLEYSTHSRNPFMVQLPRGESNAVASRSSYGLVTVRNSRGEIDRQYRVREGSILETRMAPPWLEPSVWERVRGLAPLVVPERP